MAFFWTAFAQMLYAFGQFCYVFASALMMVMATLILMVYAMLAMVLWYYLAWIGGLVSVGIGVGALFAYGAHAGWFQQTMPPQS